jgi:hypothetical protein
MVEGELAFGLTKHGGRIAGGELWSRLGVCLLFCRAVTQLGGFMANALFGALDVRNEPRYGLTPFPPNRSLVSSDPFTFCKSIGVFC